MRKYIALLSILFILGPSLVFAQLSPADTGLEATGEPVYSTTTTSIGSWVGSHLIAPAIAIAGVIFLILMIYAGFLWMTARGEAPQIKKAQDTMIRAVIGLAIILAAYAITRFIFTAIG